MVDQDNKWWRITAGRRGSLAIDWLEQDIVTIGWAESVGDFRNQTDEEIVNKSKAAGAGRQVARFLGKTKRGDGMDKDDTVIVYAPNPKGLVVGVGEIGAPEYVENPDVPYDDHKYCRSVTWYDWGTPVSKNELPSNCPQVYTSATLVEFGGSREELKSSINQASKIPTEEIESVLSLAASENDMHIWAMRNLQKIGEELSVTEHESPVSVGEIDILAEDSHGWVVIELKKGEAGDNSVGQIEGYINDLQRETEDDVRGILIAEDFSPRVKRALESDNVELYRLALHPDFESI